MIGNTLRAPPDLLTVTRNQSVYLVPKSGKPVRLNFEASFIWTCVTLGRPIDSVVAEYCRRFGALPEAATQEVRDFLERMCAAGHLLQR